MQEELPGLNGEELAIQAHLDRPSESIGDLHLAHDEGRQGGPRGREDQGTQGQEAGPPSGERGRADRHAPQHLELPIPAPLHEVLPQRPDRHAQEAKRAGGDEGRLLGLRGGQPYPLDAGAQEAGDSRRALGDREEAAVVEELPKGAAKGTRGLALEAGGERAVQGQRIPSGQGLGERVIWQERHDGRSTLGEAARIRLWR